jgi:acetate kinase
MIVAHLGSGASLAAIRNGKSVDTSMGFSPLGGIMMGTRPGDLDPGILLHLLRDDRRTPAQLEDIVTRQSGLRGVSGSSADMHVLLQQRGQDPAAAEAVELFVYLAKKQIGALAATLGGLDTLVFTGGIGAHAAAVRAEIAAGLEFLGLRLNAERNAAGEHVISADQSPVTIRVMETNENLMLALHTWSTVFGSHAHSRLLAP